MTSTSRPQRQVRFAEFHLDLDTAELRNNGNSRTLQGQPLELLAVLLERPGHLVTREELKNRLWASDTFVDFDQSLNKAVNRLREALNDSADHPRFIQTLPRRGYRFIASVEPISKSYAQAQIDPSIAEKDDFISMAVGDIVPSQKPKRTFFRVIAASAFSILLLALGIGIWQRRPVALPRVVGSTRITNDGWRKFELVSDGVRLYFSERGTILQTSTEGGETTELSTGLTDIDIYDISPEGSELLVGGGVQGSETVERPVWSVSLPAGTPRRIGDIKALWACWSPDGVHLAYTRKNAIYLAKKDGTEVRKLADVRQVPWKIHFSPDGHLRFDAYDAERNLDSIWEIDLDGKSVRLLFPQWNTPLHTGSWTFDDKYFFFYTHDPVKDRDEDLWVLPEAIASHKIRNTPVQLTKGPLTFGWPVPSREGKKLFALGTQSRAELVRYESGSRQFVPYLGGISASEAENSRGGEWVAYVSYPELNLWKSKLDGTRKLQLTFPPIQVVGPHWSPDGSQIAFTDVQPGKPWKVHIISAAGGAVDEAVPGDPVAEIDPSWLPDGRSIIFGRSRLAKDGSIQRVDLRTHRVFTFPHSERLFSPRVSPDGTYIAAFPEDATKLMLYDFRSGRWQDVAHGIFQFNIWSHTGKSIYMLDISRGDEIVRFDVNRRELERLVSLKDVAQGSKGWVGLSEGDSPILVLDKSVTDIYRLDLQIP